MALKRRKRLKTQLGGLVPIKKFNIPYLEKVTYNIELDKLVIKFRDLVNNQVDYIEVYTKKVTKHEGGTILSSVSNDSPLFIIKDVGALVEYDVFQESLWLQEDIDNPVYIVEGDPVTRIYWIDGQIDDGDGGMMDNEIEIEPYQKKGKIDPASEVIITPADEPLADWYLNIGVYIKDTIKAKFNSMFN